MKPNPISSSELKDSLLADGASIVGIADIENLDEFFGFEESEFKKYTRAISIGVQLSDEIIDDIVDGPTLEYAQLYREANNELDRIAKHLEKNLKKLNYHALAIPASKRYNQETLAAIFPHKTAAILSGLGWIGKSALFISFDYGPRVRLVTVLTNADIEADKPQRESNCGSCNNCVEHCPAKAITGELWTFGDERSKLFDAYKCSIHTSKMKKEVGETICGICIAVCPHS
ncbi:MAG: epoxyqueuosine reductase [Asgard group archaeon]|nr:epoxyqueuosine reductase [Asgard group archaeon]